MAIGGSLVRGFRRGAADSGEARRRPGAGAASRSGLEPPLTAIVQPTYQLGAKAAELLLRRIAEPDAPVTEVVLQASFVIRGSTGRPSSTAASPAT